MAGFIATELANQTVAQQIKVANGIQNLVFDEFIFVTQTVLVEDTVFINHDRVLDTATQGKVVGTQKLDVTHEPKGPRTADLLDERRAGEIHARRLGAPTENRMIEIDLEADLEAFKRHEGRALVAVLNGDLALDANELLVCVLLLQASRLNQKDEGPRTAIHDRHFRGGQFDISIVDAQPGHCREQVFHGVDLDIAVIKRGGHGGFADIFCPCADVHDGIEVDATEHDAGVHRCRLQGQVNLFPRMQAHAGGADNVL